MTPAANGAVVRIRVRLEHVLLGTAAVAWAALVLPGAAHGPRRSAAGR